MGKPKKSRSPFQTALRERDKIYRKIPDAGCTGLCHNTCTGIDATQLERDVMASRGHPLPRGDALTQSREAIRTGVLPASCSALTEDKRCAVYEDRPLICRAWGVTERLKCPYGCVPEGGVYLTEREFFALSQRMERVSRGAGLRAWVRLPEDEPPPGRRPTGGVR